MSSYEERAAQYGFATKDAIQKALQSPDTVVLDVRTPEEIAACHQTVQPATPANWVQTNCTADDCAHLRASPSKFVSDNKNATIVVHCKSGRRANAAKKVLMDEGYDGSRILNAGGFDDIKEFATSISA